jgi:hypothetical protein
VLTLIGDRLAGQGRSVGGIEVSVTLAQPWATSGIKLCLYAFFSLSQSLYSTPLVVGDSRDCTRIGAETLPRS